MIVSTDYDRYSSIISGDSDHHHNELIEPEDSRYVARALNYIGLIKQTRASQAARNTRLSLSDLVHQMNVRNV